MQHPVRYYIVKADDDQPVVRSVPVTVRPADEPVVDESVITTPTESQAPAGDRRGAARVGRIVRSAIRRTPPAR
jgi:hypothetical protein